MEYATGIGQDSHRFLKGNTKACVMGGLTFPDAPGFDANSDGDIIFHAICNAISTLTGIHILGGIADRLCLEEGITDSNVYLQHALQTLKDWKVSHVALTVEAKIPKMKKRYDELRANIAKAMGLKIEQVGLMATTGEELTSFGRGEGAQCFAIVTFRRP